MELRKKEKQARLRHLILFSFCFFGIQSECLAKKFFCANVFKTRCLMNYRQSYSNEATGVKMWWVRSRISFHRANLVKFSPTVDGKVFHVELCRRLLSTHMNSQKTWIHKVRQLQIQAPKKSEHTSKTCETWQKSHKATSSSLLSVSARATRLSSCWTAI